MTSGCAAALALGAAACIAGDDEEKVKKLPHTEGMKNEVVIQGTQRYKYEHAPTVSGAKLVEAGNANGVTPAQLEGRHWARYGRRCYVRRAPGCRRRDRPAGPGYRDFAPSRSSCDGGCRTADISA